MSAPNLSLQCCPTRPQRSHARRAERWHRHVVGIGVENPIVIGAATETPRGKRSHAVGAHVVKPKGCSVRANSEPRFLLSDRVIVVSPVTFMYRPHPMEHFIAYHNAEDWGSYGKGRPFFTAKQFRKETLIGNKLWVIEGKGKPRRYRLMSAGEITGTRVVKRPAEYRSSEQPNGTEVRFQDEWRAPVDVTETDWFQALHANQQGFRFGLNRVNDIKLVQTFKELGAEGSSVIGADGIASDLQAIARDETVDATTRLALVDARIGQGGFRADLERRWDGACAVHGCSILAILRASHIKPWRSSSNAERLDPANGLLLTAHLDAMFDAGLISFGDDGRMLVSMAIPLKDQRDFKLPAFLRKKPTQSEKKYLGYHRLHHFKT
jgi:hypothetical protein